MSTIKMTLIGVETALSQTNQSVFDLMDLPEGIDKDTVCDNILMEGSDFEVIYARPLYLRSCVGVWSKKHYRTFKKWIDALNMEYNPIENYDRMESWGDTGKDIRTLDHQDKRTLDTEDKRTLDSQDKRTLDTEDKRTLDTEDKRTLDTEDKRTLDTQDKETRDIQDKTTFDKTTGTEHTVSAFDSSTYQPSTNDEEHEGGTVTVDGTGTDTMDHTGTDTLDHTGTDTMDHTGTDTIDHTGTDTMDHTGTDTMDHTGTDTVDYSGTITDDKTNRHNGRVHGNIGVTTTQQMLESEIELARFNIVQQITDLFLTEFCLLIY